MKERIICILFLTKIRFCVKLKSIIEEESDD